MLGCRPTSLVPGSSRSICHEPQGVLSNQREYPMGIAIHGSNSRNHCLLLPSFLLVVLVTLNTLTTTHRNLLPQHTLGPHDAAQILAGADNRAISVVACYISLLPFAPSATIAPRRVRWPMARSLLRINLSLEPQKSRQGRLSSLARSLLNFRPADTFDHSFSFYSSGCATILRSRTNVDMSATS